MITAIREVRRAKGLTLEEVAQRCDPPTTPQTIGRLECGTRTVSLPWLRRIAAALDVEPADLVKLPDRAEDLALSHLNSLCASIERIYAPGANLTIISDGLVYNGA